MTTLRRELTEWIPGLIALAAAAVVSAVAASAYAAQQQMRREAEAVAADQLMVRRQQAITALMAVDRRLAAGDSEVSDALDWASPVLPFLAQLAVRSARSAIESEDLSMARYWISVAIGEAEAALQ